jgi:hypothetical protein
MAPGCVPSSLQTNLSILAAEAKRERVLHTTPKEKKAVANEERIYNQHIGFFLPSLFVGTTKSTQVQGADTVMKSFVPPISERPNPGCEMPAKFIYR